MKTYKNGNYLVGIDPETGTKEYISLVAWEDFSPKFPDSLDIKITNKCHVGCLFCHESSSPEGKECNFDNLKNILSKLPEVPIEIALGGGDITTLPLIEFLNFGKWLKNRKYLVSVTLHWRRFLINRYFIKGIVNNFGVSLPTSEEDWKTFFTNIDDILSYDNVVFHCILGLMNKDNITKLLSFTKSPRLLVLGYKNFGRGKSYRVRGTKMMRNKKFIIDNLTNTDSIFSKYNCTISFDNLAIEQLGLKDILSKDQWERFYMGNEFSHSMYIDAVEEKFAPSSTSIREDWSKYDNNILNFFENHTQHE